MRALLPSRATSRFAAIWAMTALLFAVSPLIAPGSLAGSALLSMLPFAAILAIVAIGQTLVIQQGGLDLSVPGVVSLAAVIVTKYPNLDGSKLPVAILLVVLVSALSGLVSGLLITRLNITPLIATLGMNALLFGGVLQYSGGFPSGATDGLSDFALGKTGGIPRTVIVAVVFVLIATVILKHTVAGRTFEAVGENPTAAGMAGMRVARYQISAYVLGSVCYGCGGILIAGYEKTPGITVGDFYLLPSVAAVVLGGTALTGGVGSVVATACGALFLTQLDQMVLTMGASTSAQLLVQSACIALGMGLSLISWRSIAPRIRQSRTRLRPLSEPPTPD